MGACVDVTGTVTHLVEEETALDVIVAHAGHERGQTLGVVSINIDHVHHFPEGNPTASAVTWLNLVDGAPILRIAGRLTRRRWPRLAGSDIIEPLLSRAEAAGVSVGFLGGAPEVEAPLRARLATDWPRLRVAGVWTPPRAVLDESSQQLANEIELTECDLLVVCLGKPRQELWIAEYGPATGAGVCLAFGAVVDFLAGRVPRAPLWWRDHGLEWLWRLAREPRRLARRYLVAGPPALLRAIKATRVVPDDALMRQIRDRQD